MIRPKIEQAFSILEEKGIDMPYPTYALETSVRLDGDEAGGIGQATGESAPAIATRPVDCDERNAAGTEEETLETHHT